MPLRSDLLRRLKEAGHRPRRRLGQNFLLDGNFLDAIVRESGVGPEDGVIEIGSGPGNLTERLARKAASVWAFEIDPVLVRVARERLADFANTVLIEGDGARFEEHVGTPRTRRLLVVSNLPYSEYRRLLWRLLSTSLPVESYTLMLQRDVYDRLTAAPATREYGPDSVLVQGACTIRMLRRAGPRLFHPVPRVESVLFRLERRRVVDGEGLERILRGMFSGRRKKFKTWLARNGIPVSAELGIAGERRVEELDAPLLFRLACGRLGAG